MIPLVLIGFLLALHAGQLPNTNAASCSTLSGGWALKTISSIALKMIQGILVDECVGKDAPSMGTGVGSLSAIVLHTTPNGCTNVANIVMITPLDYFSTRQLNAYSSHSHLA